MTFPVTDYLSSHRCDGCGREICTSLHDSRAYEIRESLGMGCEKDHHSLGLCTACYRSLTTEAERADRRKTIEDFWRAHRDGR